MSPGLTPLILNVRGGYYPSEQPHTVLIADGLPVPLRGPGDIKIRIVHQYRIVQVPGEGGPWKVSSAAYYYSVDDSGDREVVAYHWHPKGPSSVRSSHLHLGPGADCQRADLAAAHCPTGRISIEAFLRFVVRDFRVEPLRADWSDVFAHAQADFERWRSWA